MKITEEDRLSAARLNEVQMLAAVTRQRDVAHHLLMSPLAPRPFMERARALAEDLQELSDAHTRDRQRLEAKLAKKARRQAKVPR